LPLTPSDGRPRTSTDTPDPRITAKNQPQRRSGGSPSAWFESCDAGDMDLVLARSAFELCRLHWPRVSLCFEDLLEQVGRLNVSDYDLQRNGHDLCLALACAKGDRHAISHLEAMLGDAKRAVRRLRVASDFPDEVLQALRERLLVGPAPRIRNYAAKGSLAGWLRRAAMNVALNSRPRDPLLNEQRQVENGHWAGEAYGDGISSHAQQALDAALQDLREDDRRMLSLHAQGLSIDQLDPRFGAHRSTRARRLAALRANIRSAVEQRIVLQLGGSRREVRQELQRISLELDLSKWLENSASHSAATMQRVL
jgi:RNA polymerase sigma-70 factor